MGFFDKMKAAVGVGGAKVEVKLAPGAVPRGGYAKGEIILRAGKIEQKCNDIIVQLRRSKVVRVQVEGKMQDQTSWDTLSEEHLARYEQTLQPGNEFHYEFSILVPDEGGEEQRVGYEISASADIPGAIDPSHSVKLPTSAPQAVTAANVPQLLDTAVQLERQGGKEAQLEAVLKQIIGLDATNTQALRMLARVVGYRNAAEAAGYWKKYLELVPSDAEGWQDAAYNAKERGANEEALELSAKAVALAPSSTSYWSLRSRIFEALKRTDDALAALDKAAEGDSPSVRLQVEKAQVLLRASRNDAAREAFVLAGKKGDPYCLEEILEGLDKVNGAAHAGELIALAKQQNPTEYYPWAVHAKRALLTEPLVATQMADEALKLDVRSDWTRADLWFTKGKALEALQKKADAKVAYEQALKECKDYAEAKTRLKAL